MLLCTILEFFYVKYQFSIIARCQWLHFYFPCYNSTHNISQFKYVQIARKRVIKAGKLTLQTCTHKYF